MSLLVAKTRILLPEVNSVIDTLREHLVEHGAVIDKHDDAVRLTLPYGVAVMHAEPDALNVRVESIEITLLFFVRTLMAAHIREFVAKAGAELVWTGDGCELTAPPNFRIIRVTEIEDITPHMRRITFFGSDLWLYCLDEHIHVQLLIPPIGVASVWPGLGADGLIRWPEGPGRPAARYYTIRKHNARAGTISIDFVLHDDGGPGANFTRNARPGDLVGMLGPGGGGVRKNAGYYVFAGDETALPAIPRMLEDLPETARGVALIEVADKAEEQLIACGANIDISWLHRNGAASGTTTLLQDTVLAASFPPDVSSVFVWAACEYEAFRAIRAHLRKERNLKKGQSLVIAYWRKGQADDEFDTIDEHAH